MGKHRAGPDPIAIPGSEARANMSDDEAARIDREYPPDMSPERIERDVQIIDNAPGRRQTD